VHLAPSFDTLGFFWKDLRDGPVIGEALLGLAAVNEVSVPPRMAVVGEGFLYDCNDLVRAAYDAEKAAMKALGVELVEVETDYWAEAMSIFAPIQAHEAAGLQRAKLAGRAGFEVFEQGIAERLAWGETISAEELTGLRTRHEEFRATMDAMLEEHGYLLLPCSPTHLFPAGADHSKTRQQVLRYTTPISLAGMPTVTLSQPGGAGMQLVAGRGRDAELLGFAAGRSNLSA
jgi:Asp-tRNA(Asn)/Glu-tRNA(Gln) amidotransferase A subunit family amidase